MSSSTDNALNGEASLKSLEIVTWVLPPIATFLTLLRLNLRIRRKKFWWDDTWALIGMLWTATAMIVFELHALMPRFISKSTLIGLYYAKTVAYYSAVVSARLSILFTIIRIFPIGIIRQILGCFAMTLIVVWIILVAQTFWRCESQREWTQEVWPQCYGGDAVAIPQIIVAVITDAILIFLPLRLFWRTSLTKVQKIRLTTIFATTAIFTAVSLYHSYAVRNAGALKESISAVIEFSVGLIVANLTVIVGWLFRLKNDEGENNRSPIYEPSTVLFRTQQHTFSMISFDGSMPPDRVLITVDVNVDKSPDQPRVDDFEKNSERNSFHISFARASDLSLNGKPEFLHSDDILDSDAKPSV